MTATLLTSRLSIITRLELGYGSTKIKHAHPGTILREEFMKPVGRVCALVGMLMAAGSALADGCKLTRVAQFPIKMVGTRPLVAASINGVDVQFVVDSGAFYSMLNAGTAAELKLIKRPLPAGLEVSGIHGTTFVSVATANTFTLPGFALHDVEFFVGGNVSGEGSVGLLGQNFLSDHDVEYDLGQGVIRLMKPADCSKAVLAYWISPSTPYSMIDITGDALQVESSAGSRIKHKQLQLSRTLGRAYVNGIELRVIFDTGAETSMLSVKTAARAGIKTDSPGVVAAGVSRGIGKDLVATYIAPVASFKIGDEEIKNTHLAIGDIDLEVADMLLGADFFLSHRIYVANSQRKLYFTYNGGPVFKLTTAKEAAAAQQPDKEAGPRGD